MNNYCFVVKYTLGESDNIITKTFNAEGNSPTGVIEYIKAYHGTQTTVNVLSVKVEMV